MALEEYRRKRDSTKTFDPPPALIRAGANKVAAGTERALFRLMAQYPEVQLATLVDEAPEPNKWVHEVKYDGYRLLGFVARGRGAPAHPQRQ